MASYNEQKLNTWSARAIERAELAEIEEELQMVGNNMKQLEMSVEKAVEREEKLKDNIFSIQNKCSRERCSQAHQGRGPNGHLWHNQAK